jgi:VanZ family protein
MNGQGRIQANFARYQLPALLWAGLIFVTSSIPSSAFPELPIRKFDKVIHAGIFLVFCLLVYRALRYQASFPLLSRHCLGFSLLLTFLYGILDELHQYFVPGRSADPFDLMADTAGGILVVVAIWVLSRIHADSRGAGGR